MFNFRLHRGGFNESMETKVSFTYLHELVNYIHQNFNCPLSIAYTTFDTRLRTPFNCGCFCSCIVDSNGLPFAFIWED